MLLLPDIEEAAAAGYVVQAIYYFRKKTAEHGIDEPPGVSRYEAAMRQMARTGHLETPVDVSPTTFDAPPKAADDHPDLPLLLTRVEAARVMRISTKTLDRRIDAGIVPVVHIGKTLRIRRTDVEQLAGLARSPEGTE